MKSKNRSFNSTLWMQRHLRDKYVQQGKREGLRSRAWFKLSEIQKVDKLFRPGVKTVIDLGSTPGGWSQFIATKIGKTGRVIACDLLPMDSIANVEFLQEDICNKDFLNKLKLKVLFGSKSSSSNDCSFHDKNYKVQVITSDIAPNMCGIPEVDIPNIILLMEKALEICFELLEVGGSFLVKAFQGDGLEKYLKSLNFLFKKIKIRKPNSSRSRSREIYIVATGFRI